MFYKLQIHSEIIQTDSIIVGTNDYWNVPEVFNNDINKFAYSFDDIHGSA